MQNKNNPMERMFLRNARQQRVPISGTFELTPRCTLDCKMCYIRLTKEEMGDRKELSTEKWLEIIDEVVAMGTTSVQLTGGECLLHEGFKAIYEKLRDLGVFVSINTNATLLNDEYIDYFKQNPPARIQFSLYGSNDDVYERVTGVRIFDKVSRNILKAKEAGLNIKVNVTVSRYLYDDTINILKFLMDHHIAYLIDMNMVPANEDTNKCLEDYALTTEEIVAKYKEIVELKNLPIYENDKETELPVWDESADEQRGYQCAAGRSKYLIKWDGTVEPCFCETKGAPNLLYTDFKSAWERIVKDADEYLLPIECDSCKYRPLCIACPYSRNDPEHPGHCNRSVCETTIAKYNAGLSKLPR